MVLVAEVNAQATERGSIQFGAYCFSDYCRASTELTLAESLMIVSATLTVAVRGDWVDSKAVLSFWVGDESNGIGLTCRGNVECAADLVTCFFAVDVLQELTSSSNSLIVGFVEQGDDMERCGSFALFTLDLEYELPTDEPFASTGVTGVPVQESRIFSCSGTAASCTTTIGFDPSLEITEALLTVDVSGDLDDEKEEVVAWIADQSNSVALCKTASECGNTRETCMSSFDVYHWLAGHAQCQNQVLILAGRGN